MAKYKLRQFAELETFSNVVHQVQQDEHVPDHNIKGRWRSDFFLREGLLTLELGCGKGEYTLALAENSPDRLFIGVDLKGNRLWRGALTANQQRLLNAGFLRCKIENLKSVFAPSEIDEIWITFPDPQPGLKREKKRLTGVNFLEMYREILKPGGLIHLKTDSKEFYSFSKQMASEHGIISYCSEDLYHEITDLNNGEYRLLTGVKTFYEKKFLAQGMPICYLRFSLV